MILEQEQGQEVSVMMQPNHSLMIFKARNTLQKYKLYNTFNKQIYSKIEI